MWTIYGTNDLLEMELKHMEVGNGNQGTWCQRLEALECLMKGFEKH